MDELENELTSSGDGQAIEQPQEPEGNTENNKSQTIEEVEQKDVADNHRKEYAHYFPKIEEVRIKNTVTRNIHHSATERRTDEDTDSRHEQNPF